MKNIESSNRLIFILYRFMLPVCISFFLLVVSQNIKRPWVLGTQSLDFFARLWIVFSFCLLYLRLSDLERYMFRTYSIVIDHSKDHELPVNWRNIFFGVLLGAVSTPFTWWIIKLFLPIFSEINWLLTLVHGLLLSIPMTIWRNELVM